MTAHFSFAELEILIQGLDSLHPDCMSHISSVRFMLEDAYSARTLTLRQWRLLWEEVSLVQARCAMVQPDAWRFPTMEDCNFTYIPPPPAVPLR
jgi:hypothetical protein